MASTQLEICNMALDDVGNPNITSLSGSTKAQNLLKNKWQTTVDAVLGDHNWSFAICWAALPLHGKKGDPNGPVAVYEYAYGKPQGYIRGIRLEDAEDKWEEVGDQIHTDVEGAIFQYVKSQTDVNKFPALFALALAKRLASEIAVPLNQDKAKARELFQVYQLILDQAKLANGASQQNAKDESPANIFSAARD